MRTLRIANGDIFIGQSTGQPEYVSGSQKGSQDVARHLLTVYNSTFQEGNELINFQIEATTISLTESLVQQLLYEAINRLIIKQRVYEVDERIVSIIDLKVRVVGLSTVVFFVQVLFEGGETGFVVDFLNFSPTELNQILSPDAGISI